MELTEIKRQLEYIETHPATATHCNGVDMAYFIPSQITELVSAVESLTAEKEAAVNEAKSLAVCMWRSWYKDDSPNWEPLDTAVGMISQINNMVAGLRDKLEAAESSLAQAREEIERLKAHNDDLRKCGPSCSELIVTKARAEAAEQREKGLLNVIEEVVNDHETFGNGGVSDYAIEQCKTALAAASKEEAK